MKLRLDSKYRLRYKSTAYKVFHLIGKGLLFLIIVFLLVVGFTQTSYFRNLLREQIISLASKELNGNIQIESIYGTLFSSLTVKNLNYSLDGVEFISAKIIHISVNPIALIQNKIVINKFFLENFHINLIQFKDGKWITDKILKYPVVPDTTPPKKFDYELILKKINLSEGQFRLKSYADSTDYFEYVKYPSLNLNDLFISNFNLELSARSNPAKNIYELQVHNFQWKTNINNFSLEDFGLKLFAKDKSLSIEQLKLKTLNSNILLNLKVDDFDLNDEHLFEKLPQKNVVLKIDAQPFDFSDLRSLLPVVNMLHGKVFLQGEANGSLENLNVDYMNLRLDSTQLNLFGILYNITEPDKMYIKAHIKDSELLMKDISNFLPLYNIPVFDGLGKLKLDIEYDGAPLNFMTNFKILSSNGSVNGLAKFNFTKPIPDYSIDIQTKGLNLEPFLKTKGNLNSRLTVRGEGFEISTLKSFLLFEANNSQIAGNNIDTLTLDILGQKKNINVNFSGSSENLGFVLNGFINFQNEENPSYDFKFNGENLDLSKHLNLRDQRGIINFAGILKGYNFDPDVLEGIFKLKVYNSLVNNYDISDTELLLQVKNDGIDNRLIQLRTDFVDLDLLGNYKLSEVIRTVPEKFQLINKEIEKKTSLFNGDTLTQIILPDIKNKRLTRTQTVEKKSVEPQFNISYKIDFKNSNLINSFLKNIKLNLNGNLDGRIINTDERFLFENNGRILDFWIVDFEQSQRIKNTDLKIVFETSNSLSSEHKIKLFSSLRSERIQNHSKIENLDLQINFDSDLFKYRIQSTIDSLLFIRSEGKLDISTSIFKANIAKATIEYKKYKLTNQGSLNFSFSKEKVFFERFVLRRKNELFKVSGEIGYYGDQDLELSVSNFNLSDLVLNFFPNMTEDIEGEISINVSLNGTAEAPLLDGSFEISNLIIGDDKLGQVNGKLNYANKTINIFSTYIDSIYQGRDFELTGSFPIDLSLKDVQERLNKNREFTFVLNFNDFNLQPLQAVVPIFKSIEGSLNGNIRLTGTINKPEFYGSVSSRNMNFVLAQNNLKYSADIKVKLNESKITIEQFELANLNTRKRGRLFTSGEFEIDQIGLKNLKLKTSGSLLVLGQESRAVSQNIYGDLFIETASPIVLEGSYNTYNIKGDVNIKETSLVIPPIQSEYTDEEENFVYKYIDYSPPVDQADIAFIQAERELRGKKRVRDESAPGVLSKVSGKIKISLKNNVSLLLVFNQELNQRLVADLRGEVIYNFSEGTTSAQGEIELTKDSYLVFYQRFLASGKIRFENDLSNPFLDVTANYSNYYVQGDTVNQQIRDVLIKLRLVGTVTELGKNLVSNRENIEISIDGTVDPSKDASDVVAFILVGKFKDDLTAEDKTGALSTWGGTFQSAAGSLLGSVITNFANSILGDVLRNVEFRKVGEETQFSFEGRVKDVRFKVGGGTDVLQNFALANIQIEYPVSERLFLRLIRKQSQMQVSKPTEMINEVGLKYKVEF